MRALFVGLLALALATGSYADVTGPITPIGGGGSSGSGCTLANPSATIGLTAANGIATTCMASDSAPALSLAIAPGLSTPWTASPWFWSNAEPRLAFLESDQGTNLKGWDFDINAGVMCFRTRTDADAAGQNVWCATRGATTALTNETFGYSVAGTYTFPFTGLATFSGPITVSAGQIKASTAGVVAGAGFLFAATGTCSAIGQGVSLIASGNIGFCYGTAGSGTSGASDNANAFTNPHGLVEGGRSITAAGAITQLITDRYICVNKTTGAASAVALVASPTTGTLLTVDDCKGDAATNNITITPNAGNIDGSATFVITTNFGSWTGRYTGTIWKTEASK